MHMRTVLYQLIILFHYLTDELEWLEIIKMNVQQKANFQLL